MAVTVYKKVKKGLLTNKQQEDIVSAVLDWLGAESVDVSVHAIGDQRMQTLNRTYRDIDKTTDVLSFPTEEYGLGDAGDIFISVPQIKKQARQMGVKEKEEYARMLIHGTLHLFGYDHVTKKQEKEMFGIQEELLARVIKKHV